jgi:hypothetical protein
VNGWGRVTVSPTLVQVADGTWLNPMHVVGLVELGPSETRVMLSGGEGGVTVPRPAAIVARRLTGAER